MYQLADEQANGWLCRSSRGQCVAKTCALNVLGGDRCTAERRHGVESANDHRCSKKRRSVDVPRSGQAVLTGHNASSALAFRSAAQSRPSSSTTTTFISYPDIQQSTVLIAHSEQPTLHLPISTSLHRLTTVDGGRAALPCHPPTRQCAKTRRHRTWHSDTFSGRVS